MSKEVMRLTLLLLIVDCIFVVIHVGKGIYEEQFVQAFGQSLYDSFTITKDWSIPEITNYLKFAIISFLLLRTYSELKHLVYFALSFIFLVALCDDALQVHERLGEVIGAFIDKHFSMAEQASSVAFRSRDIGEFLVFAIYGVLFSAILILSFLSSTTEHRSVGYIYFLFLGVLAIFATLFDLLNRVVLTFSVFLGDAIGLNKSYPGIFLGCTHSLFNAKVWIINPD